MWDRAILHLTIKTKRMKRKFSMMLLVASVVCLTACSGDEKEVRPKIPSSRNMKVGESFNLGYKADWASANKFAATVNSDGVVIAEREGTARIYSASENLSCNIFVTASFTLYNEPIKQWGISKSSVKSQKGTPSNETSTTFFYNTGSAAAPIEGYQFEGNSLTSSIVLVKTAYSSEIAKHLIQRYAPVTMDSDEGSYYFADAISPNSPNTLVLLQYYNSSYLAVLYAKYSGSTVRSSSSQAVLFEKMKAELNTIDIIVE